MHGYQPHPADPRMMAAHHNHSHHHQHHRQPIHPAGYEHFEPPRHPHYSHHHHVPYAAAPSAGRTSPYATYAAPPPPAGYPPHPHHGMPPRLPHPAGYQPHASHHAHRQYRAAPSPRHASSMYVPSPHAVSPRPVPSHDVAVPSAAVSVTSSTGSSSTSTISSATGSPPPIVPSISASSSSSELVDLASSSSSSSAGSVSDTESQTSSASKVEVDKRSASPSESATPRSKKGRLLARMATPSPQPSTATATGDIAVSNPVTPPRSLFKEQQQADASSPSTPSSTSSTNTSSSSSSPASPSKWTESEDAILRQAVTANAGRNWKRIALSLPHRTDVQCLHRWQKVLRPGLVKGPWTPEEDDRLIRLVKQHGVKRWSFLAQQLDSGRLGKQCRERWYNHLDPSINKGAWTREEDDAIIAAHDELGSKWAQIARAVGNGRTDNAIKNRWNSTLRRVVSGEVGRPSYGDAPLGVEAAAAAGGNDTTAAVGRKRSRESSTSSSSRSLDDIDYDLLSKDRSTCTPEELDRIRRERNRMHARRSRERKRARAEAASAGTAPDYARAEYVRKVSTATPPPTPEGGGGSAPSTPSTLATIKSIRSDVSDDDAIAAEALSTLTTSSPALPRPNLIMSYSSDESSAGSPTSQQREEVPAKSMVDMPGLAVPALPKTNSNEEDAVGLLLHFNNQTKTLQCQSN